MEEGTDAAWWQTERGVDAAPKGVATRRSRYLTMRDGCRIAIDLYLPRTLREGDRLPTILRQTRYYRRTALRPPFSWFLDRPGRLVGRFLANGYAWVSVDARGTGASYGQRQMEWSPDEVRDGAEVVDWIVAQPWSNGLVGTTGVSYDGTAAEMLLRNRHPAVRAAVIRYSLFDVYADIAYPGGIRNDRFLRAWSELNDALDHGHQARFVRRHSGWRQAAVVRGVAPVDDDGDRRALREAIRAHEANYNIYATALEIECRDDRSASALCAADFSPHAYIDEINASPAAVYSWSSWFDGRYTLSAIRRYLSLDTADKRLILGPWDHGGRQVPDPWSTDHRSHFDHAGEMLRFFDLHLKGVQTGLEAEPPVHYYTMGEGAWKSAGTWPPPGFEPTPYYLAEGGSLRAGSSPAEGGADRYRVDPSTGSGQGSRWYTQVNVDGLPIRYPDRRAADERLLTYTSPPLPTDAELTGHPIATIYIRAQAPDVHLFLYLEDVAPSGEVRYVTEGLFRARHRQIGPGPAPYGGIVPYHTFKREDAMPLVPGGPAEITFDLMPVSYLYRRGHAVRLAIAGADADNLAVLVPDPPEIEVLHGGGNPSRVVLPLAERSTGHE